MLEFYSSLPAELIVIEIIECLLSLFTADGFGIDAARFTSRQGVLQYCQQILAKGKSQYNESVMYANTNQAFNLSFAFLESYLSTWRVDSKSSSFIEPQC